MSRAFNYYVEDGQTAQAVAAVDMSHSVPIVRGITELLAQAVGVIGGVIMYR
jgi:hypothetical protein